MALLVLVALVGGFLVGRSGGERFPRAWPTPFVRAKCRILGHHWRQQEGPFTVHTCRRCDVARLLTAA